MTSVGKSLVSLTDESGNKLYLSYNILVDFLDFEGSVQFSTYGVFILMLNEENRVVDYSEVRDVDVDAGSICKLIADMARLQVTPISLKDIIDDFIAA